MSRFTVNEASPAYVGVFSIELGEEFLDRFIAWPCAGKLNWIKQLRFLQWNRE